MNFSKKSKKKLEKAAPDRVPMGNSPRLIVIDFMAYARKIPTKKANLKTFGDFVTKLWNTFSSLASNSTQIDIVFDIYLDDSIKACERARRQTLDAILTVVSREDQPLPVDMKRFWASSENKASFEQFFIKVKR